MRSGHRKPSAGVAKRLVEAGWLREHEPERMESLRRRIAWTHGALRAHLACTGLDNATNRDLRAWAALGAVKYVG